MKWAEQPKHFPGLLPLDKENWISFLTAPSVIWTGTHAWIWYRSQNLTPSLSGVGRQQGDPQVMQAVPSKLRLGVWQHLTECGEVYVCVCLDSPLTIKAEKVLGCLCLFNPKGYVQRTSFQITATPDSVTSLLSYIKNTEKLHFTVL